MAIPNIAIPIGFLTPDGRDIVKALGARLDSDKATQVVTGIRITFVGVGYMPLVVKLPDTPENRKGMERIQSLIKDGANCIDVRLKEPHSRIYAFISNGNLVSGVSVKASSFVIVDDETLDI